jgi:sorbitol-specific phosphotransferase system component IIA
MQILLFIATSIFLYSTAFAEQQAISAVAVKEHHSESFKALKGAEGAPGKLEHGKRYAVLDYHRPNGKDALKCVEGLGHVVLAVGEVAIGPESAVAAKVGEKVGEKLVEMDWKNVRHWGLTKPNGKGAVHHAKNWAPPKEKHHLTFKGIVHKAEHEITSIGK